MNAFATSNITEPVKQFPAQSNIENSISKEELVERTDLEEETIDDVLKTLKAEFED